LLAMDVNDDAGCLNVRGAWAFFASRLAPTGGRRQRGQTSAPRPLDAPVGPEAAEFDFDRRRPVNHAGRTQALRSGETGKDAGLAALGHGWPIAATRGAMPE